MSATVTYKGSTLTTVDNQTKTLKTAGKYMEADVVVTDVTTGSGSAVTVIDTQDEAGGTIRQIIAVDLSYDTVTAATLKSGVTAHDKNGNAITGELDPGGIATLQTTSVSFTPTTASQSQTLTPQTGYDGFSQVAVSVSAMSTGTAGTPIATKSTVSNHAITVTPSVTNTTGYITGGTKTGTAVSVAASEVVSGTRSITSNGTGIDVTNYATVNVAVPTGGDTPTLQTITKTYTPTQSQQTDTITPDSGYDGLSEVDVTVNAISATYVGSGITQRSSSNLTVSGSTVTAPAGYYPSVASTSVASGSVTAPSSISGTGATVSTETNTLTLTKTVSVTPNVTTSGYISSGTAGNSSVSLTAAVVTKAAATITPSTANQTISSGTYLTGTQTISGDSNLTASNIKAGVSIFNVNGSFTSDADATAADINNGVTAYVNGNKITGTQTFSTISTGSSTPSSSTGSDGDIYLVLV